MGLIRTMVMLRLPQEERLLGVPGWLTAEEGQRLAYLASRVPSDQAIVEIGSFYGRSTGFLAAGSATGYQARVFAIDVWKHGGGVELEVFENFLAQNDLRDTVQPLPGRSTAVSRWWQKPIGLLFIDGAHDWASVKADYASWVPHLVPGSWLAIHDYHPNYPDVLRFMDVGVITNPDWRWASVSGVSLLTAQYVPAEPEAAT